MAAKWFNSLDTNSTRVPKEIPTRLLRNSSLIYGFLTIGIYFSGQSQIPFVSSAIGQPFNPSYVTLPILPFRNGEMNLVQRTVNTFATFMFEHVFRNFMILRDVNGLLDRQFPGEIRPNLLDLEKNVSVVFSFGHPFILDGWSPIMPNYIPLGNYN